MQNIIKKKLKKIKKIIIAKKNILIFAKKIKKLKFMFIKEQNYYMKINSFINIMIGK